MGAFDTGSVCGRYAEADLRISPTVWRTSAAFNPALRSTEICCESSGLRSKKLKPLYIFRFFGHRQPRRRKTSRVLAGPGSGISCRGHAAELRLAAGRQIAPPWIEGVTT